jgi:hypothetical protein
MRGFRTDTDLRFRGALFGNLWILAAIVPNAEPIVRATVTRVSLSVLRVRLCNFVFILSSVESRAS